MTISPLCKEERAELKRLTRRVRTGRATQREFNQAVSLMERRNAAYEARVRALEAEGLSRSDAQSVVDAEELRHA